MSPQFKDKLVNFTLGLATLAATAYAFLASIFGSNEGSHQWIWITTGVLSSALAVYVGNSEKMRLTEYRNRMRRLATDAEKNYENLIANLAPSIAQSAVIADTTLPQAERDIRRGRLDQSVVVGVSEISDGARGVFYRWDAATSIFSLTSQWPTTAVREIKSGTHPAYSAPEITARTGQVLTRNDTASPFHSSTPTAADDSVVVVQVISNDKIIGILAMDAKMKTFPASEGFAPRHVRELMIYANELASGLGA
ncbi:hypothetical protein AB5J52_12925 [Streptomyces sp. R39]|uniref:GAF domain-containing protein n=1 Tax=Streptomyces sp. R39 TaxID=3238631 RepID=A0AB39QP77_9ACTN